LWSIFIIKNSFKMEKQHRIKFIDGSFTAAEAAEVLFAVLGDKIRFHNIQVLSLQERFNKDASLSKKRLAELHIAENEVSELLAAAREAGATIEIQSTIQLTIKQNNQVAANPEYIAAANS